MMTLLLALFVGSAHAGVLETWGGGEIGSAGNAGVATSDAHSAWYNPAALDAENFDATTEIVYGNAEFSVSPAKGKTVEPYSANSRGVLLGVGLNNYWLGLPRSNFGLSLFLPAKGPFSWYDPEDALKDEPASATLPRWSSELSRLDAAVGGNYWLTDHFAIGAGVDISATFVTLTFIEIDDFYDLDDPDAARKGQDVTITPTFHPTVGMVAIAGDPDGAHARIGLLGKTARWMDDSGTGYVKLFSGGENLIFQHHYYRYYAPPTLTLGVNVRPVESLSVRAESSYGAWSRAHGPFYEDLSKDWSNTVTARLGAKVSVDRVRILGGYAYDPSPVRTIPRNTLIVDGPSHSLTAGLGAVVRTMDERNLTAMIGMRSQRFASTTIEAKGAGNPEFEGGLLGFRAGLGWGR